MNFLRSLFQHPSLPLRAMFYALYLAAAAFAIVAIYRFSQSDVITGLAGIALLGIGGYLAGSKSS